MPHLECNKTNNNKNASRNNEDIIQTTIGDFGRWQMKISILMALMKLPIAWFQMSIVFLAPPTEFWCKSEYNAPRGIGSGPPEDPPFLRKREGLNIGFCHRLNLSDQIVSCTNGFEYNTTIYHSTIVTEWDLVCHNKRLIDLSQIIIMLGVLIGNIIFGVLSDRFGRKKSLLFCILFQTIFGVISAQVKSFWLFIAARFLLGIANGGTIVISFVICMEVVGGKWRTIVPILYQIPYGVGNTIMAALAYYYRDWRDLQTAISVLSALYILYVWFVPESPRWLLATGQQKQALEILCEAAKTNNIDENKVQVVAAGLLNGDEKTAKGSFSDLFATRDLRKRLLLLGINGFAAGLTFYAFSQYTGKVADNLYVTVAIGGFVAFPGTILCVHVVHRYGRRITISTANILTAICFFGILFVPQGVYVADWPRLIFAGIGVIGLSVSMPAFYLFTAELFPTTIRNAGVGFCIMFSRIGSLVAPLIISLQDLSACLPLIILGVAAILQAILILPLPETKGSTLPETIGDIDGRHRFRTIVKDNENFIALPMINNKERSANEVEAA